MGRKSANNAAEESDAAPLLSAPAPPFEDDAQGAQSGAAQQPVRQTDGAPSEAQAGRAEIGVAAAGSDKVVEALTHALPKEEGVKEVAPQPDPVEPSADTTVPAAPPAETIAPPAALDASTAAVASNPAVELAPSAPQAVAEADASGAADAVAAPAASAPSPAADAPPAVEAAAEGAAPTAAESVTAPVEAPAAPLPVKESPAPKAAAEGAAPSAVESMTAPMSAPAQQLAAEAPAPKKSASVPPTVPPLTALVKAPVAARSAVDPVAVDHGEGCTSSDDSEGALSPALPGASQTPGAAPPKETRLETGVPPAVGKDEAGVAGLWHHWPQVELPKVEPISGQALRVFCGVWNLHGKQAPADLSPWVARLPRHHIYVIGTCEAGSILSSKAKWENQVLEHLGREDFYMIGSHSMGAIHIMVFIHKYLWKYCHETKTTQVATGFGNVIGNKGGTLVGCRLGHTSVLFANAHLPAHQHKMKERTQSFSRILLESSMRSKKAREAGIGLHEEYDRVFFMGDLNTRLAAKRDQVDAWLAERQLAKCLEVDQLLPLLRAGEGGARPDASEGLWHSFEEAPIDFPPTYKFDTHSDRYDSSKKRRVPSWTDRILWKRSASIRCLAYNSIDSLRCSDHRPIFGQYEIAVDLKDWTGPDPHSPEKVGRSLSNPSKAGGPTAATSSGGSSVCNVQ